MSKFSPPNNLELEGNVAENWERWKKEFHFFLLATESQKKDTEVKCSMLLSAIGPRARDVYYTFDFGDEKESLDFEVVMYKFDKHFRPKKNVTFQRYKFFTSSQKEGQKVEDFVTDLRAKANHCEFEQLKESLIKDILVCGVASTQVQERLLREPEPLHLDRAIEICRSAEETKYQIEEMQASNNASGNNVSMDVNWVNKNRKSYTNSNTQSPNESKTSYKDSFINSCKFCGGKHKVRECPAYGKSCLNCGRQNHFAKVCKSKTINQISIIRTDDQSEKSSDKSTEAEGETLYVDQIDHSVTKPEDKWHSVVSINGNIEKFKLDTGSQVNLLSANRFNMLRNKPQLRKSDMKLTAYNGTAVAVLGTCLLTLTKKGNQYREEMVITKEDLPSILGLPSCVNMNLIKQVDNLTTSTKPAISLPITDEIFGALGSLAQEQHLTLKEGAIPVVHAPRRVPEALKEPLKNELDRMLALGVIEKVEEPRDWVSSLVLTTKANGKLRVCLDPKDLNKALKRSHYQMPTAEEIFSKMGGAKFFSKMDASSGFWQIKVDSESSKLLTFNTPFGRYAFTRLPFGILCAPEIFQKEIGDILDGLEGQAHAQDDIIVWGKTEAEHNERLEKVMKAIQKSGLKLNKDKCEFGVSELVYLGHKITSEGIKPDESKIVAVKSFPYPQSKEELQRFLGMTNYLAKFLPQYSQTSAPVRELLEKETAWHWDLKHSQAIDDLKQLVTNAPVLKFYDGKKAIKVSTDASKNGLGSVLFQKHGTEWYPVAYASRSLTKSEINYAQIEKECLAILFACNKFHQYLYGQTFKVESDHKPLIPIFAKPLIKAPPRIQRMLLNMQKYDAEIEYVPGKTLLVADALSRVGNAPCDHKSEEQLNFTVCSLISNFPMSDRAFEEFVEETKKDVVIQDVINQVQEGWLSEHQTVTRLKPYYLIREELWVSHGLLWRGERVIVPSTMRPKLKKLIHEGHLGIVKCRLRARQSFFWPSMNAEIEDIVSKCETCQEYQNRQPREPLLAHESGRSPFEKVGADLFSLRGNNYLIIIDYFSNYPEVCYLNDTSSKTVIQKMKAAFARYGIPKTVISDGGPQFKSIEFKQFSMQWDFIHIQSSPYYPQSNGLAERTVQTIKKMFEKCLKSNEDPYLAILAHRSTPMGPGQSSPAELLMGRRLRTKLPVGNSSVLLHNAKWEHNEDKENAYNQHKKHLTSLQSNDKVRMHDGKTWNKKAVILQKVNPRSYQVLSEEGKRYVRNRQHLRPTLEAFQPKLSVDIEDRAFKMDDTRQQPPEENVAGEDEGISAPAHLQEFPRANQLSKVEHTISSPKSQTTRSGRRVVLPSKLRDYVN